MDELEAGVEAEQRCQGSARPDNDRVGGRKVGIRVPPAEARDRLHVAPDPLGAVQVGSAINADPQRRQSPDQITPPAILIEERPPVTACLDDGGSPCGIVLRDRLLEVTGRKVQPPAGGHEHGAHHRHDDEATRPAECESARRRPIPPKAGREYGQRCEHRDPDVTPRPQGQKGSEAQQEHVKSRAIAPPPEREGRRADQGGHGPFPWHPKPRCQELDDQVVRVRLRCIRDDDRVEPRVIGVQQRRCKAGSGEQHKPPPLPCARGTCVARHRSAAEKPIDQGRIHPSAKRDRP